MLSNVAQRVYGIDNCRFSNDPIVLFQMIQQGGKCEYLVSEGKNDVIRVVLSGYRADQKWCGDTYLAVADSPNRVVRTSFSTM